MLCAQQVNQKIVSTLGEIVFTSPNRHATNALPRLQLYVQKLLCSEGPMFRRFYVQKVLCSEGPMFRRFYDQKALYSEGSMFRKSYVQKYLFRRSYV